MCEGSLSRFVIILSFPKNSTDYLIFGLQIVVFFGAFVLELDYGLWLDEQEDLLKYRSRNKAQILDTFAFADLNQVLGNNFLCNILPELLYTIHFPFFKF
jgi:hypothetical protein